MGYCLCIPEGSGIILDDALSKRTTGVYPVTEHHMILLRSIRFFKALWLAFSHSSSYNIGHTQLRGLTYSVCSVIPLRRVTFSSECVFSRDKIFCKSTILSNLWECFPSRVSFAQTQIIWASPILPAKIFVSPGSLDQSLLQEQSLRNHSGTSFQEHLQTCQKVRECRQVVGWERAWLQIWLL